MLKRILAILTICSLYVGCEREQSEVFHLLDAEDTGITFNNAIHNADSLLLMSFEYVYNGGGVAIGDINNDGLPDIYFTGNMVSSKLYLNQGNFKFEDITEKAGVTTDKWASGASMVDINQDGFMDLYVCAGGLYNGDESRSNLLFINNGDNTFKEESKAFGLDDSGYSQHAAFLDYDKDGDLDLYLLTNELDPYNWKEYRPRRINGEAPNTDKLYKNNGNNTFTNVSAEAGILIEGYGLGVGICDINNDNWPDVYVANDFLSNDLLYINQQDGTFKNEIDQYLDHQSRNGMGTDLQDINNDGHTDIMVLDMLPVANLRQKTMFGLFDYDKYKFGLESGYQPQYARNTLQLNNGNGTFSEIGQLAGVNQTDWSWSTLMEDFDNDGLNDILITNGFRLDVTNMDFATYSRQVTSSGIGTDEAKRNQMLEKLRTLPEIKLHNYIYKNEGSLSFSDKSKDWGLSKPSYSNGTAFADLDNDGDLDLVINNIDDNAFIYRNDINLQPESKAHSLQVKLEGTAPNLNGIGAKVIIKNDGITQAKYFSPYRGYISTMQNLIHFGLGSQTSINELMVIWPDGKSQVMKNIDTDQVITLRQTEATEETTIVENKKELLFSEVSSAFNINYEHQEKDFADFKVQPILPHKHSQLGPGVAVGDVNGDGLDDLYLGGSQNYKGQFFIQNGEDGFTPQNHAIDSVREDMGSLLFDADNDGDNDLYIVGGGSSPEANSISYIDQLYINDGNGNFSKSTGLPKISGSGSVVTAGDYDQDGDLDLFIGGRIVPGSYPIPAKSYLLRNDSKNGVCQFTNITAKALPENGALGLVTSALWSDYDNDNKLDLIITGEWMPISIFKNTGEGFEDRTTGAKLNGTHGWWNSLASGDFDSDGDIDYIAGNLGLNTKFKASAEEPVCIYAKDYDKNGRIDPVMCYYIEGENYIAHSRDNLIEQISSMRGRFKTYEKYGKTPFSRSFMSEELEDALIVKSETFASSYIENLGNGEFKVTPLPLIAQLAPLFGMKVQDFDQDGHLDILAVGNSFSSEVAIGQYDACKGLLISGDGAGGFKVESNGTNGFFVRGDAKGLSFIDTPTKRLYIATQNNGSAKVFLNNKAADHKTIRLMPDDVYGLVSFKNGKTAKQEFYYGSTYLSQSSRSVKLSGEVTNMVIYNSQGENREIEF